MSAVPGYFRRQMQLMRISGIPVCIDHRWFIVLALMSAITAASINALAGDMVLSLILGFAATVVFFASILFHEFAHAVIARTEGSRSSNSFFIRSAGWHDSATNLKRRVPSFASRSRDRPPAFCSPLLF